MTVFVMIFSYQKYHFKTFMKNQKLFIVILLSSLLVLSSSADQNITKADPTTLNLDKQIADTLVANQTKHYVIPIDKTYESGDWNMFVVVSTRRSQAWQKTLIRIYKLDSTGKQTLSVNCTEVGVDACLINRNKIYSKDTIHVEVKCFDACEYDIHAYWSESMPIRLGHAMVLDFEREAYAKVFTLNLTGETFDQLRILLTAPMSLASPAPVHMMANYGKSTPTVSSYDLKSIHIWDDGQGIFIEKTDLKDMYLTILVEGPAENVLHLKAEILTGHATSLAYMEPTFDYLPKQTKRTYIIDASNAKSKSQDIIVKVAIFTGHLTVTFYKDEKLNSKIFSKEFSHLGDLQYKFTQSHRTQIGDKIYMKVTSQFIDTTYLVTVVMKEPNKAIKLSTQVAEMSEINQTEADVYYTQVFSRSNDVKATYHLDFVVHNFTGAPIPIFHICRTKVDECASNLARNFRNQKNIRLLKPEGVFNGQNTTSYKVNISIDDFSSGSGQRMNFKKLILMILVYTESSSTTYSITNVNHIQMRTLRESHPIRDRLSIGEHRYYKVAKPEPTVKAVKVHIIEISGASLITAYRVDPRGRQKDITSVIPSANTFTFTENLQQNPIFLKAIGEQSCLYSLSVSFEREQRNDSSEQHFNYITLIQNVEQQITTDKGQTQVVSIHPTSSNFSLKIHSTNKAMEYCATHKRNLKPVGKGCDIKLQQGENNLKNEGIMWIGIINKHDKSVRTTIGFTDSVVNCESKKIGHVWTKKFEKDEVRCIKYILPKIDEIEIFINVANLDYQSMMWTLYFSGSKDILGFDGPRMTITKEDVARECKVTEQCELTFNISKIQDTEVQVLIQYTGGEITLLDGLPQTIEGPYYPNIYRNFKFHMANKIPTTVIIESKRGYYSFYVDIIDQETQHSLNISKKFPTKNKSQFASSNAFYSSYNMLQLTNDNLTGIICTKCVMLISVVINSEDGEPHGKYIIEVTQQIRFLKEHAQAIGRLEKHAMAFYGYYLHEDDRTIVVSLSTGNIDCATIYLAKGEDKPASNSNNVHKSRSHELVYRGGKGPYSITVEANEVCRYSISVSSTKFRLYELTNGVFKDIKLKVNETVYAYYEHLIDTSFKLLAMENEGQILIKANITNAQHLSNLDVQNLTYIAEQSKDVFEIKKSHKSFCFNCIYLFELTALSNLEASIIISSPGAQIPILNRRDVTDIATKDLQTTFRLYDTSKVLNVSVLVYFGEIKFTILGNQQNETKAFKKSDDKPVVWSFSQYKNGTDPAKLANRPLKFIVTSESENAMYNFIVNSSEASNVKRKMKEGVPSYIFVSEGEEECIIGKSNIPLHLLISTSQNDKAKLQNLNISVTEKPGTHIEKKIIGSTMRVDFVDIKESGKYTFCFKSKSMISMTIVPVGSINLFPENVFLFVKKQSNFSLNPSGKIMLEVFECTDKTSVLFSSKFSTLSSEETDILQWRRFGTNNVMEVEHYGPVFLNVNGGESTVRWFHVDDRNGDGQGYYYLKTPRFFYTFQTEKVNFNVSAVSQTLRDKLNIIEVEYTLLVSDNFNKLKTSAQCSEPIQISETVRKQKGALDENVIFELTKSKLDEKFSKSQYLFVSVTSRVVLKTKLDKLEHYKLISEYQEIPWKVSLVKQETTSSSGSSASGFWKTFGTLLLVIGIIVLILFLIRFVNVKLRKYRRDKLLKAQSSIPSGVNDVELKYASFGTK